MNLLFICGRNRLRSPTAESVFAAVPGIETRSAGVNPDAEEPVSLDLIEWADRIFVMEHTHRTKLNQKFKGALRDKKVVCLSIPDEYEFMDQELIALLRERVALSIPELNEPEP